MSEPSTKKVDDELLTNLKRAQKAPSDKPLFFALVVKGTADGKLIISKYKIPEKQVGEAKKATGGTTVVKGLCFGEDGQLVFETAKPPAPSWAVVAKKLAKDATGLLIKPVFTQGRDDEAVSESVAEPDAGEVPAAPAQPAEPDLAAAWLRRVAGVSDRVKAAVAARHPAARDMILGVSQAQAYFRGGHAADAEARLKEVEVLLGPAPAADPGAEYKARFAEWQGVIKQALTAKPPNAGDIGKLLAQATALSKPGGDPAQALEKLKECHALATAALAAPAGPAPGAADPAAEYKARFAEWQGIIKQALTAKPPNAGDIGKLLAQATALSKPGGDPVQALEKLRECHALATAALAAPAGPAPGAAAPAAEYKARFAEWQGVIKQALTAKPPNAGDIGKLLAQATALSKPGGDPAQALEKLKECHALATAALAAPVTPVGPAPGASDTTAEYKARFAEWQEVIKQALLAKGPKFADIGKLLAQATALSKPGGDIAQALAKLKECHALATGSAPGAPSDQAKPAAGTSTPTARWEAERAKVVARLQREIKAVVATQDPDAGKAELELRAVLKQLAGEMQTQKQAAEMERFLREDDVVADVSELAFDLRTPLRKVLAEITPQLSA